MIPVLTSLKYLQEVFREKLVTQFLFEDEIPPNLDQLCYKILIKNKKLNTSTKSSDPSDLKVNLTSGELYELIYFHYSSMCLLSSNMSLTS